MDFLATGHAWSGGGGPITLAPLVGLLLTVVLSRWLVGLRISPLVLGVSVLLGTLFAVAADAWGMTVTLSAWTLAALVVSASLRRTRGTFGHSSSD